MKIEFGAFANPLCIQLSCSPEKVKREQKYADDVVGLLIGGVLTDGEAHKVRKRIVKKIEKKLVKNVENEKKGE